MAETDTATQTPEPAPPAAIHLARCATCDFSVRYSPSSNGHGFVLLDSDRALGIGDAGRPICPNGHGEMEIADDRLPIEQAIGQVAEQLDAHQPRLPGIVPPFNYAGAYMELEAMSVEADRLHRIWEDDAREAKESKTQWEDASKRRDKAALEFRRRRLDKGEPTNGNGNPEQGAAVADELPAPNADLWDAVKAAGQILLPGTIEAWSQDERDAVRAWASDQTLERPKVLGTPHVTPNGYVSETHDDGQTSVEFQSCTQCDERILTITDGVEPYEMGALVGTDCKGKPKKEPARYPKRGKKKSAKAKD